MSLSDLTRESIFEAIKEFDVVGRKEFLSRYGFHPSHEYFLTLNGNRYDSKAIVGRAHSLTGAGDVVLKPSEFSGGEKRMAALLRRLGFTIERLPALKSALPELAIGNVYSWEELATLFGFRPELFAVGGGMISRPALNATLLITHPGGARSFDYEDRWDQETLVYTGRGKKSHQTLSGPNLDVAENRRNLLVFEAAETRSLRFIGQATCVDKWLARSIDTEGYERNVWKFRLSFRNAAARDLSPTKPSVPSTIRRPRPFAGIRPVERQPPSGCRLTEEEIAALQEKANTIHFETLRSLAVILAKNGWRAVEEIPSAVDLQATMPDREERVIFEVKSLSDCNDGHQCRAALAQLLEYRFLYGDAADHVCAVFSRPIADRRLAFLEAVGIAVMTIDDRDKVMLCGQRARLLLGKLDEVS